MFVIQDRHRLRHRRAVAAVNFRTGPRFRPALKRIVASRRAGVIRISEQTVPEQPVFGKSAAPAALMFSVRPRTSHAGPGRRLAVNER
jgi:hypothetical protein